jgi:ribonucleoside-diphosphate reductase alpha chain
MNLYAYVNTVVYKTPALGFSTLVDSGSRKEFDFQRFATDVKTAIRFLDNVIDKTPDYLPETSERQRRLRRVGLGVMGLADALVALGIRYGSPDSVSFVEDVFRCMKDAAIESSLGISKEKGPAGGWSDSMASRPWLDEYVDRHPKAAYETLTAYGMRNIFLLTQAPTGTTSLLADVNSGIEPYFNKNVTWREDRTGGREIGPRAVKDLFSATRMSPETYPDYVVDSSEVTVDEHIAIQAAVQKYVDSSVSKTINAPKEQTVEETSRAFTRAYYSGLKGIAYYRDGSRDQQVLYHQNPNDRIRELEAELSAIKSRPAFQSWYDNAGSLPFQKPVYRDNIQLFGVSEDTDAARFDFYRAPKILDQNGVDNVFAHPLLGVSDLYNADACPSCSGRIVREEGCMKCYGCGWAAC